jgi:putative DNA primase/helicase
MAAEDQDDWLPEDEDSSNIRSLPAAFNHTDLGNAERLVAHYRDRVHYSGQRKKWLLWDGTRWRWDETFAIERMAKRAVRKIRQEAASLEGKEATRVFQFALQSESAKAIKAMLSLAQSEDGVPIMVSDLDADPYLLNAPNGTIDLRTGEIRDHRRTDLITRTTGVKYDANAQSKVWDRVLLEACGGDSELALYLQHVIGYSLIGLPLERALFFLYGPPGTAKSTLIDAFHAALGDYAQAADFDTWLLKPQVGGNRGDLVRLAGARLVTSSETKPGVKWDEKLLKGITGGDTLTACAKYENEVSFKPACTLLFAANDAPAAREDDDGFWARMRRIPITHQIPPERQDKSLKRQLREPEHQQAVLAWAVKGCAMYTALNGFPRCAAVEESTTEYRAELDHFSMFLSDRTETGEGYFVSRRDLRRSYVVWAEEVGRKVLLDDKAIVRKLRAKRFAELPPRNGYAMWGGLQLKALGSSSTPDESRWG